MAEYVIRAEDLVAGAFYTFQLAAVNGAMHGPPSVPSPELAVPVVQPHSGADLVHPRQEMLSDPAVLRQTPLLTPTRLPVLDRPAAPAGVMAMAENGDVYKGVKVGWSPLPVGTATSFVILGTREGQPRHAVSGRLDASQTEHFIPATRLVKGARYHFQVAALNDHVHGPASLPSGPVEVTRDVCACV